MAIGTLALGRHAALGQSGGAHVHMPEVGVAKLPIVPAMDQPLVEPEVRRSANGVLSTSLRCAYAYRDIGGTRLYLRGYEGGLAPTLRMKPGETLKIRLINDLPPNRDIPPSNPSYPHQFNNTNLHFHGAHCSPSGIADNVMRLMAPGKSYDIEIALPADHTRGTYWYHPHFHGSADVQVASGMVGAIVVEGDFADVREIAQARERVMLLSEVVFDAFSMVEDFGTLFPETATRFLAINGQRRPAIDMRPGEVQRWRLVGSQYQDNMLLELDGHRLNVIAYDGIPLGAVQEMKQLLITPGQRADVLVQAGGPGTYELNAMPFDQGHDSPTGPLARVVVAGEPLPMKLPAALPKPPLEPIRDSEITGRRTLVFGATEPQNNVAGHWQEYAFNVDGKIFDPVAHRPAGAAGRGGGMDDPQHPPARRPYVSHPHQPVPGHRDRRSTAGRSDVARYRGRAAAGQRRQHRYPLAFPRLHRRLHDALPHDEPRGVGHDAGGRGLRRRGWT